MRAVAILAVNLNFKINLLKLTRKYCKQSFCMCFFSVICDKN